jgi:peptidoglycan-associated lipoprotein
MKRHFRHFFLSLILGATCIAISGCTTCKLQTTSDNIPMAQMGDLLQDVHFAFDSSALESPARGVLRENNEWLAGYSDSAIEIEGHCDERGTTEYNLALGMRRAEAVHDYLRTLGVASTRMTTVSYGEEVPLDPELSPSAWAQNRRAHFLLK